MNTKRYVYNVNFQASRAERPNLAVTCGVAIAAETPEVAWREGQKLLESQGWTIRERTGRAARRYRVQP